MKGYRLGLLAVPLLIGGCCSDSLAYDSEAKRFDLSAPLAIGGNTLNGGLWIRQVPSAEWGYSAQIQVEGPYVSTTKALGIVTINDKGEYEDRFVIWGDGKGVAFAPFEFRAPITVKEILAKDSEHRWPDYVLAPGYRLRSLYELEAYIRQHSRLPGLISAEEAAQKGVPMLEIQRILVEKVEELTLYTIALQRQIDSLKQVVLATRQSCK
ncbi:MAG: hypothetical protein N3E49_01105 [Bacteroidia bacterium]|nr:hypothetical protein [Bacteroidia bacterium]